MPSDELIAQFAASLRHHQHLRDIGSIILLFGVIAEILIDEFWEFEHPPLLRGKKATKLLIPSRHRMKKPLMLFVGIVLVGGGIVSEWWYGKDADQDADAISRIQQARIADAESEQAIFERLVSPRQFVLSANLWKLAKFKDTPFWTQSIEFRPEVMANSEDLKSIEEAASFAGNFGILRDCCGWKLQTEPRLSSTPDFDGIQIYSRRADPAEPYTESDIRWPDPYAVPWDTPERKGWAAASALVQYLRVDLGFLLVIHLPMDDIHGNLRPEFAGISNDGVVIEVGRHESAVDLQEHAFERQFPKHQ
jgi:hypothetical protein